MNVDVTSDAFINAVADGIREFNQKSQPIVGTYDPATGNVTPVLGKEFVDRRWQDAVRYGINKALASVV